MQRAKKGWSSTMKKLTAMLLSLVMCFSLLAISPRAVFNPDPNGPGTIDVDENPAEPGDQDPDDPGISVQGKLPEPIDNPPAD